MPITVGQDTAKTRKTISVNGKTISYYSIPAATEAGLGDFSKLPAALKVVLENMLRFEDGKTVSVDDIKAFSEWADKGGDNPREVPGPYQIFPNEPISIGVGRNVGGALLVVKSEGSWT